MQRAHHVSFGFNAWRTEAPPAHLWDAASQAVDNAENPEPVHVPRRFQSVSTRAALNLLVSIYGSGDRPSAGLPSSFSFSVEGTRTVKTESKQITTNPIKSKSSGQREGVLSLGTGAWSERMRAGAATSIRSVLSVR